MKISIIICALISSSIAININCRYEVTSYNFDMVNLYTCVVTHITLTGSPRIESVTGSHLSGRTNADVQQINFGWSFATCAGIDFIPQGINDFFPNTLSLLVAACGINTLTGEELNEYQNLMSLTMRDNQIERIPGNFFQNNLKIQHINFINNTITRTGSGLLDHLDDLMSAYFDLNICINDRASQNRTGVLRLIETLRVNCSDPEDFTTTLSSTTVTSTHDPTCPSGNTDQRICNLEEENKDQHDSIEGLRSENERINRELEDHKEKFKDLQDQMLKLEELLLELTSRPCACK
jgi:hypothetical protein